MQNTIVHHEGAAPLEAVGTKLKHSGAIIKIGLDVHARVYVAVAQFHQLLPKPVRRFAPLEFVPWVEDLLRRAHRVWPWTCGASTPAAAPPRNSA